MDASVRSRSLILSVLIHTALLVLLLFIVMRSPIPPFIETGGGGTGVLVNIGNLESASGDVQPMSSVVNKEATPVKSVPAPPAEESKIATQNTEESYAMTENKKKNTKPTETKATKPVATPVKVETKPIEKPRTAEEGSVYKGKSNVSKSQGTASSGTGDQGDPKGDPNSTYTGKNGSGTGPGSGGGSGGGDGGGIGPNSGRGISFELSNRKLLIRPSIDDRSQETGKVVVSISVDKNGNVTSAIPGVRGSTTTSAYLFTKAKDAAMKAKFNVDPAGNDIQKGTMTFVFLVH